MTEEAYFYFMEVLPPKRMNHSSYLCSEAESANKHGEYIYLAATKIGAYYFAKHGTVKEFDSNKIFNKEEALSIINRIKKWK